MLLAIDASTYSGSVAVLDGSAVLAERRVTLRSAPDDALMPAVVAAVESSVGWDGLSGVFVSAGPGTFTPLRIAASIGKGIAVARGLPLCAGSSLALVAADPALGFGAVHVALDALRGEVFFATFDRLTDGSLRPAGSAVRVPREEALRRAIAAGGARIGAFTADSVSVAPRAAFAKLLIASGLAPTVDLVAWEPDYGRLAEAQVKWETAHGRPLPTPEPR